MSDIREEFFKELHSESNIEKILTVKTEASAQSLLNKLQTEKSKDESSLKRIASPFEYDKGMKEFKKLKRSMQKINPCNSAFNTQGAKSDGKGKFSSPDTHEKKSSRSNGDCKENPPSNPSNGSEDSEEDWLCTGSIYLGLRISRFAYSEGVQTTNILNATVFKWLPEHLADFTSSMTGKSAALWKIRFDDDAYFQEDLEEYELIEALILFRKKYCQDWLGHRILRTLHGYGDLVGEVVDFERNEEVWQLEIDPEDIDVTKLQGIPHIGLFRVTYENGVLEEHLTWDEVVSCCMKGPFAHKDGCDSSAIAKGLVATFDAKKQLVEKEKFNTYKLVERTSNQVSLFLLLLHLL